MPSEENFPRAYVEELRRRSDGYRRRANVLAGAVMYYAILAELIKREADPRVAKDVSPSGLTITDDGFVQGAEAAVQAFLNH